MLYPVDPHLWANNYLLDLSASVKGIFIGVLFGDVRCVSQTFLRTGTDTSGESLISGSR